MTKVTFLREFLRDPMRLGAVAPSGSQLARQMVDAAGIDNNQVVVELGAGTGPMTAELLSRQIDIRLVALEPNPTLAGILSNRFPTLDLTTQPAQRLPSILAERGLRKADRIVSSLPWAIWSDDVQNEIFEAIFDVLRPGGRMVTFTYLHLRLSPAGFRFRRALESRFGEVFVQSLAWANLPPAMVLSCTRT